MSVDLFYDSDCPLAAPVRGDVLDCLAKAGLAWELREHLDEGRLSPTLLLDGSDVLGDQPPGSGCRLERPSRAQIIAVLTRPSGGLS